MVQRTVLRQPLNYAGWKLGSGIGVLGCYCSYFEHYDDYKHNDEFANHDSSCFHPQEET